jgi:hypothetical protein
MPAVVVEQDIVRVGDRFAVAFERTLRIPEDGCTYPLPPGLGRLPVDRARDFPEMSPPAWVQRDDLFVSLYQREALWLAFDGAWWKPNAVQVALGSVDAVSGEVGEHPLSLDPQNYLVTPDQPWLDGVNAGDEYVRQFVAVPLGADRSVEAQVSGSEAVGGLRIRVFEPKPGRFPDEPPEHDPLELDAGSVYAPTAEPLGIGAGGRIRQRIYPDAYGLDTWDAASAVDVRLQIINSEQYHALTGRDPPPTPVSAATYTERGLPWFELYDEAKGDVTAVDVLESLRGTDDDLEQGVDVDPRQVEAIELRRDDS